MGTLAATVFLSALLLFLVQPLVGKAILPWFGGTSAVWMTCMLFFQVALVGGYAYAHAVATRLSPKAQGIVHLALLATTLAFLPIVPAASWAPTDADGPVQHILLLLAASVGPAFFALATTAPLMQIWFARGSRGGSPYRLYALSNAASLIALFAYPFLLERFLPLAAQDVAWSVGYVSFALLCGTCAVRQMAWQPERHEGAALRSTALAHGAPPSPFTVVVWVALAACASTLLLATTNQLCMNVAVVPFLWVLPLALYLLTFILCFESDRWYRRSWGSWASLVALGSGIALWFLGTGLGLVPQVAIHSAILFIGCMTCHGELAAARPSPRHLTVFYLWLGIGGALGGVFVGVLAPMLFEHYTEFPLALLGCSALLILARRRTEIGRLLALRPKRVAAVAAGVALVAFAASRLAVGSSPGAEARRNFYGVLQVFQRPTEGGPQIALRHGTTLHGTQFLADEKRRLPTTYYGADSGAGVAIEHHPRRADGARIGVVGLGAGTLAAHAAAGDEIWFFEIDRDVEAFARARFTYLADAEQRGAKVRVSIGDARLVLEGLLRSGGSSGFDVLVLDAFSSDAVPVHLLTREAFEIYRAHLAPGGVLAMHVSNRYLDLDPVVRGAATALGFEARSIHGGRDPALGTEHSEWLLVAEPAFFAIDAVAKACRRWPADAREPRVWTDDFSSLFGLID